MLFRSRIVLVEGDTEYMVFLQLSSDIRKMLLVACKTNFEVVLLDVMVSKDKTYYIR